MADPEGLPTPPDAGRRRRPKRGRRANVVRGWIRFQGRRCRWAPACLLAPDRGRFFRAKEFF